jgi:hypothetical protein
MVQAIAQPKARKDDETLIRGLQVASNIFTSLRADQRAEEKSASQRKLDAIRAGGFEQDQEIAKASEGREQAQFEINQASAPSKRKEALFKEGFRELKPGEIADESRILELPPEATAAGPAIPRFLAPDKDRITPYQQALLDLQKQNQAAKSLKDTESLKKVKNEQIRKFANAIDKSGLSVVVQSLDKVDSLVDIDGTSDVPGVGGLANVAGLPLVGGGAEVLLSQEGQNVRQAVASFRNIVLKARSGGAVTPSEAERMLEELGLGAFRTDAQLRQGLRNARDVLNAKLGNLEAAVDPEALAEYRERKGAISTNDKLFRVDGSGPQRAAGSGEAIAAPAGSPVENAQRSLNDLSDDELDRKIKELEGRNAGFSKAAPAQRSR